MEHIDLHLPDYKVRKSLPNGLRKGPESPLVLCQLGAGRQSWGINPVSRTWGLVRDTASLGWQKRKGFFFWTSVQVSLVLDTHTRLCPFAHLHRTFTTPHYTARLPQWPTQETTTKSGCKLARLQQSDTRRKRRREGGREGWWCRELMMILFFNFHLTSCRMIGQFLQKRVSVRAVIPSPFLYSFKLSPPMLTHLQL